MRPLTRAVQFTQTHVFLSLILIVFCGLLMRTVALSRLPVGFHVDEVKVGWNAYSILKTGKDDWGNRFALHYNTFGDYRPSGIFYVTIPFIKLLGLNVFSVRLPSALFGSAVIVVIFFLARRITNSAQIALAAAAMTALSPWQIVISRATSEVIISSFFVLLSLYFLVKALQTRRYIFLFACAIAIVPSYLLYHTARVLTPMFIAVVTVYYLWGNVKAYRRQFLFAIATLLTFASVLFLIFGLSPDARARYNQISIPHDPAVQKFREVIPREEGPNHILRTRIFDNKYTIYATTFINNYLQYFSPNFFVTSEVGRPERYVTANNGIITYVEFGLFLLGLVGIFRKRYEALPLLLFLLAPIPSALTTEDSPNLHRALLMSPFLCMVAGYGLITLFRLRRFAVTTVAVVILLLTANLTYFWYMYAIHNEVHFPMFISRNIGALETASELKSLQNNFDTIYVTNYPDEFYPWYAFINQPNPASFNQYVANRRKVPWDGNAGGYQNIIFTPLRCPSELFKKNPPAPGRVAAIDGEACDVNDYHTIAHTIWFYTRKSGGAPYIVREYVPDPSYQK